MWYWRRMEKINWNDRVSNGEVIHRVKEERISYRPLKEGRLPRLVICYVMPSNTPNRNKDIRKDRSEGKTRKKA